VPPLEIVFQRLIIGRLVPSSQYLIVIVIFVVVFYSSLLINLVLFAISSKAPQHDFILPP
jgi:hypothetical protein